MIVFGIDPGSHNTGWGVLHSSGNQLKYIDAGVIRTKKDAPLSVRIDTIFDELLLNMGRHKPDRICLESIFHHKSARSALVLGHARGVALLAARRCSQADIHEISPAEVKKAVTGHGRADKKQVQAMIRVLLGLPETPPADAADALAVAIAGATRIRNGLPEQLKVGRTT